MTSGQSAGQQSLGEFSFPAAPHGRIPLPLSHTLMKVLCIISDSVYVLNDMLTAIALYSDLGVPAARMVVGVPFYGRNDGWTSFVAYADLVEQCAPASWENYCNGHFFNGPDLVAQKAQHVVDNGIAGMMISEVDLVGIITSPKGEIAFLNGSDNKGYFMRSGDNLYDGTVMDIDRAAGRVIFRQKVDDPREIKPYREIIKKLYSSTEDGQ